MRPGRLVAARPVFIGTRERTYLLIAFIRTVMSVLLGPGTLYRCLKDLTSAGLVERVAPPDSDNPHRKYYRPDLEGRRRTRECGARAISGDGNRRVQVAPSCSEGGVSAPVQQAFEVDPRSCEQQSRRGVRPGNASRRRGNYRSNSDAAFAKLSRGPGCLGRSRACG